MILYEGDRIRNKFNKLIGRIVGIILQSSSDPVRLVFHVSFEDDAAAFRHYARNGPNGTYVFTNPDAWEKIPDEPIPMEDTRDYLEVVTCR